MSARVRVTGLTASYGRVPVLRGVDLVAGNGDLVAVLGPSGCGKSTLLRVLAGHHRADGGTIEIGDDLVDGGGVRVAPERRRVTVVPQDGLLFPHLDVAANVAFGLRGARDAAARTQHMLELVGLAELAHRRPHELSGGQQQRVAVARALAPRPTAVLLDEPFSALDVQLRDQVRSEVTALLRSEGVTTILVTHDQEEALSVADSVAVMREGRIQQQGTPQQVYDEPADAWCAEFVGEAILLEPRRVDDRHADTVLGPVAVEAPVTEGSRLLVRPEQLVIDDSGAGAAAVVESAVFHGPHSVVVARLDAGQVVRLRGVRRVSPGDRVRLRVVGAAWPVLG